MQKPTNSPRVTLLLGTATQDSQHELVTDMARHAADWAATGQAGQIFYLVPNHIAYEMERVTYQALSREPPFNGEHVHAFQNIQVLTVNRLIWYFLQTDPQFSRLTATDTAQTMILTKVLLQCGDDLQLFRGETRNPGFLEQLRVQLGELADAGIDATILDSLTGSGGSQEFQAKMHDLTIILRAYQEELGRYFVTSDEMTQYAMTQFAAHPEWLANTQLYINGFDHLDGQTLALLGTLIPQCQHTTIALVGDQYDGDTEEMPAGPGSTPFFTPSTQLRHQVQHLTQSVTGIPAQVRYTRTPSAHQPALVTLAHYWISNARGQTAPTPPTATAAVRLWQAANRQDELTAVAAEIHRLVASGDYRYGDIRILTPDLEKYETIIAPTFHQAAVPYFYDRALAMTNHPLVQLISALGELLNDNVTYANLFSLLRTELLLPAALAAEAQHENAAGQTTPAYLRVFRDQVDAAENYCLAHGLRGSQFSAEAPWQELTHTPTDEDDAAEVQTQLSAGEPIHVFLRQELLPFIAALKEAPDGQHAMTALYQFLTAHGLITQLAFFRNTTLAAGDPVGASRPRQAFAQFTRLLDEYVEILGSEPFVPDTFVAIFTAGFTAASYAQIPAVLDTVQIADTGITVPAPAKITFVIGGTANALPAPVESTTLLNDSDRAAIIAGQQALIAAQPDSGAVYPTLSRGTDDVLAAAEYMAYKSFFSATDRLYLTYPQLQSETSQRISPYFARIQNYLGLTPRTVDFSGTALAAPAVQPQITAWLATPALAGSWTVKGLREKQSDPYWQVVAQHLRRQGTPTVQQHYQFILTALHYQNTVGQLDPAIVRDLYGKRLNVSVSRLEQYYQNPYEYFLHYGLGVTERPTYDLTPAETGSYYHWVLDHLVKRLQTQAQDITDLSQQELHSIVDDIAGKAVHEPLFAILNGSGRMKFLRQLLERTLTYMAWLLQQQAARSALRPLATEVQFGQVGQPDSLPALTYPLGADQSVRIRGKIDRIDGFRGPNGEDFLTVVDYKSSEHQFDYGQALTGLSLQLQTYLQALLNALGQVPNLALPSTATVAGGFYLHINEPLLPMKDALKWQDSDPALFTQQMLKQNQFKGIVLADDTFLEKADTSPDRNVVLAGSRVTKKNGYTNSNALSADQLATILAYNAAMIQAAAKNILGGKIDLQPARFPNGESVLRFSPYTNIMYFDHMLPENKYREIITQDKQGALQRMSELLRKERDHE
ncbi:PD-(D/E)XK nuclease family protein [Schleiferilactobacillus harbinensis]|uniref:PD-(D/E)XK nuclease family protein n=1 Tax=Schleiferilactobacillus harbinensis TaxID=304207 RepID=UPI0021A453E3|nr:PD-(D/E)XK nuclease family protein [Schleiferilactobacillus harbinensis]